jgi:hypothetical protein
MLNSILRKILIISSLALAICAWGELPEELKEINKEASKKDLSRSCVLNLNHWLKILDTLVKKPQSKSTNSDITLKETFLLRLKIHEQLGAFPVECKKLAQGVFARIREYEDIIGASLYAQTRIADVDYTKIIAPVLDHRGYAPFHVNPKFAKFTFEDGDILITKGISTISSTITTFTDHHSPFSHIAFVHIDPIKKEPQTIESYVGRGVNFFSMTEAMKNENSRILVLRPKDRTLAKNAATYMRERVQNAFKKGSFIPYDYQLDFSKNDTLSCEEVAFDSFKTASGGSFTIPEAPSLIKFENTALTSRVGMKKGKMMMPADMEVDSRFEIVLDWTDYKVIRDSWRKDVLMNVTLHANEAGTYDLPENYKTRLAPYVWGLRKYPSIWPYAAKLSGIPVDFTPDVPAISIATIGSFKQIEIDHLPGLQKFDEDFFKKNQHWPNRMALIEHMNQSLLPFKKK